MRSRARLTPKVDLAGFHFQTNLQTRDEEGQVSPFHCSNRGAGTCAHTDALDAQRLIVDPQLALATVELELATRYVRSWGPWWAWRRMWWRWSQGIGKRNDAAASPAITAIILGNPLAASRLAWARPV